MPERPEVVTLRRELNVGGQPTSRWAEAVDQPGVDGYRPYSDPNAEVRPFVPLAALEAAESDVAWLQEFLKRAAVAAAEELGAKFAECGVSRSVAIDAVLDAFAPLHDRDEGQDLGREIADASGQGDSDG